MENELYLEVKELLHYFYDKRDKCEKELEAAEDAHKMNLQSILLGKIGVYYDAVQRLEAIKRKYESKQD